MFLQSCVNTYCGAAECKSKSFGQRMERRQATMVSSRSKRQAHRHAHM